MDATFMTPTFLDVLTMIEMFPPDREMSSIEWSRTLVTSGLLSNEERMEVLHILKQSGIYRVGANKSK